MLIVSLLDATLTLLSICHYAMPCHTFALLLLRYATGYFRYLRYAMLFRHAATFHVISYDTLSSCRYFFFITPPSRRHVTPVAAVFSLSLLLLPRQAPLDSCRLILLLPCFITPCHAIADSFFDCRLSIS